MAEQHRRTRQPVRGAVGVVAVLVIAGFLFAANARLAESADSRHPQDLAELVEAEQRSAEELEAEVVGLLDEVDRLTDAQTSDLTPARAEEADLLAFAAGRAAVTGPGLTVRLTDAQPSSRHPDWVTNDYLVIHQQDLQAVINALWAGGAEAMTLQGQRVISTSAFRCVGNVLLLHGQTYSPPYVVQAIGDPEGLRKALLASPEIQDYLDYVDLIGLGWSVTTETELLVPGYERTVDLKFAAVPEPEDS